MSLLLHFAVVAELSRAPSFDVPIVDEASYDQLARDLVAGRGLDGRLFWQGLLYPLELALVYAATGGSIVCARVAQSFAGAAAAGLTCKLGERVGGRRVGLAAGLLVACSGPLLFLDFELAATAWEVLWGVALPLLAMRAAERSSARSAWLFGAACGAGILTRAAFAPFTLAAIAWLAWSGSGRRERRWARAATSAMGVATVLLPAVLLARSATGEWRILPYSGAINLYIGNGQGSDDRIRIRPGEAWDRLASQPARRGAATPSAKEAYFVDLVERDAVDHPGAFALGLAKKAVELVSSREIPRNLDVYTYRAYSAVLEVAAWRAGPFGFPFGLVFPFALVGLVFAYRAMPAPLVILLVTYSLSIVAVFVTARYRAPILPAIAIAAAMGARRAYDAVAAREWPVVAGCGALALSGAALSTRPGPFAAELGDPRAEMLTLVATEHFEHGRFDDAESLLHEALDGDPRDQVAHCVLGSVLARRGDLDGAADHFASALALDSGSTVPQVPFHANAGMGSVLVLRGTPSLALPYFREALKYEPDDARLLDDVGQILHGAGDDEGAARYLRRAVFADPSLDVARKNLERVEAALRGRAAP